MYNPMGLYEHFRPAMRVIHQGGLYTRGYTPGITVKFSVVQSSNHYLIFRCLITVPLMFFFRVLDMLRFHKFTIGKAWVPEFGDPDNKEDFEYLIKYRRFWN